MSGPLLVEEYADRVDLAGAKLVGRTVDTSLWRPLGSMRVVSFTSGRYFDGWYSQPTHVIVWPAAVGASGGVICMRFALPPGASTTLQLDGPSTHLTARIAGGAVTDVAVPVHGTRSFGLLVSATRPGTTADGRTVAAFGSPPRFIAGKASPSACR